MLLSAVSVLVVAQSISEIPEGLMNNPVYRVACLCVVVYNDCSLYAGVLVLCSCTRIKKKILFNVIINQDYCETERISFLRIL